MAVRRGAHVLHLQLHDPNNPSLLGPAPPPLSPGRTGTTASYKSPPAIGALEERLVARDRDIQELLLDNQRFAAVHVALKQRLLAAQRELRAAAAAAGQTRAEVDADVRALLERAAMAEAEARGCEHARAELGRVRADVQLLGASRDELAGRAAELKAELARVKAEAGQAATLRGQIEAMHVEIEKGRAAIDFEKNAHANNLKESHRMETKMILMGAEIEKLRAELENAEKRAAAAAAAANPGYAAAYGNSEVTYGASSYADTYSTSQVQRGTAEGNTQYASTTVAPYAQYDPQQSNVQR